MVTAGNMIDKLFNLKRDKSATPNPDKRTTLDPRFKCDDCGDTAMVYVDRWLYCPKCYLKKQGAKIKSLDHTGFYP